MLADSVSLAVAITRTSVRGARGCIVMFDREAHDRVVGEGLPNHDSGGLVKRVRIVIVERGRHPGAREEPALTRQRHRNAPQEVVADTIIVFELEVRDERRSIVAIDDDGHSGSGELFLHGSEEERSAAVLRALVAMRQANEHRKLGERWVQVDLWRHLDLVAANRALIGSAGCTAGCQRGCTKHEETARNVDEWSMGQS
jgi:hypothetical protein